MVDFLLKILEINNRCDLNYKMSNNKRLHLELALMQMCSLVTGKESVTSEVRSTKSEVRHTKLESRNHMAETDIPSTGQAAGQKKVTGTVRMKDIEKYEGTVSIKPQPRKESSDVETDKEDLAHAEIASVFSQELLNLHWDKYAETLKLDFPHLYSMLKKHRPVLMEEFRIDFSIDNRLLEEELNEKKGELLGYLKKELNNYKITLQTRISEADKNFKPYTDKEKFEKMAEKNPALRKLKDELDLEIEF